MDKAAGAAVIQNPSGVLARCYNIADLREAARRRLPRGVFEFFDRGSEDEVTLRANRSAFQNIKLRNRVLVDVSQRSAETTLFNKPLAMPIAIAPTGIAGICWHEGELALARAAAAFGVPFTLATPSLTSIEKAARAGGRLWFQLYMWRERELSYALVQRAQDAGYEALILTVDTAVQPIREYNLRNGFGMPFKPNPRVLMDMAMHPRWLASVIGRYWLNGQMPKLAHYPEATDPNAPRAAGVLPALRGDNLTWDDVKRLRDAWMGAFLIKGVHRAEDALRAAELGLDGVIISNHGGRNLDSAVSPLDVLPEIAKAAKGRLAVLVDSGVRRGGDIFKALALGADAVLAGRAPLYGASVAGEAGVMHALTLLRNELETTMGFTGCGTISDIGSDAVWMAQAG